MPSEQQLNSALREKADLEQELRSLEEADDPQDATHRIMDFIANTNEGLIDEENNPWLQSGGCCIIL